MAKGHLHFLGIFGHAMRGVALAAKELGYTVSGTDDGASPPTEWLDGHGIQWWAEADPAHLSGVTEIIISGHIQPDHPELMAAQEQGIPIRSYPELVGELTAHHHRIVVSGTHGKTTTTALITWLLESAGRNPDYLVGILPKNFDTTVRLSGKRAGGVAVLEGDEYRASALDPASKFDYYHPHVAVLTSVELDHPDFFTGLDDIKQRFEALVGELPDDGGLYYWGGSETVRDIAQTSPVAKSYGLAGSDWCAQETDFGADGLRFTLAHHEEVFGQLSVPLYGSHNILNSLAAAAVVLGEGVSFAELQQGLASFLGASRRFERVSEPGSAIAVFDDYAHHPTEVATTLEGAKLHFPGRLIAVFQPHTYSRTKALLSEYGQVFAAADTAFITTIEGAREQGTDHSVSGEDIARLAGESVSYIAERAKLLDEVVAAAQPGDTIVTMSVGGNDSFAKAVADRLAGGAVE